MWSAVNNEDAIRTIICMIPNRSYISYRIIPYDMYGMVRYGMVSYIPYVW